MITNWLAWEIRYNFYNIKLTFIFQKPTWSFKFSTISVSNPKDILIGTPWSSNAERTDIRESIRSASSHNLLIS